MESLRYSDGEEDSILIEKENESSDEDDFTVGEKVEYDAVNQHQ